MGEEGECISFVLGVEVEVLLLLLFDCVVLRKDDELIFLLLLLLLFVFVNGDMFRGLL